MMSGGISSRRMVHKGGKTSEKLTWYSFCNQSLRPLSVPVRHMMQRISPGSDRRKTAVSHFRFVEILDVDQLQIAHQVRLDLFLREHMDQVNVVLAGDEVAQGVFVAAFVHEVAQEDDDSLAGRLQAEGAQGFLQVARP